MNSVGRMKTTSGKQHLDRRFQRLRFGGPPSSEAHLVTLGLHHSDQADAQLLALDDGAAQRAQVFETDANCHPLEGGAAAGAQIDVRHDPLNLVGERRVELAQNGAQRAIEAHARFEAQHQQVHDRRQVAQDLPTALAVTAHEHTSMPNQPINTPSASTTRPGAP